MESNAGADIEAAALPVARGANEPEALHGGEDYELLFTASPKKRVPSRIDGLSVTRIGTIVKTDRPGSVRIDGQALPAKGFDHFA